MLASDVDLVRVQRNLRADATDRLWIFAGVAAAHDGTDKWLDEMGRNADWRKHQRDEGKNLPVGGTFDPEAARDSSKEALGCISQSRADLHKLAK